MNYLFSTEPTANNFVERADAVLAHTFLGLHNVPGKIKNDGVVPHIEVCVMADMASHDFDRLTRLVIAAHAMYIRVEISGASPRYIRIRLSNRVRSGRMSERHPSLEDLGAIIADTYLNLGESPPEAS